MIMLCASYGYSQESLAEQLSVRVVEGRAQKIDSVGQILTVRIFNDEITIFVPDKIQIARGSEAIPLDDINVGDSLRIKYYDASPGPLTAISITDNNAVDDF
ncbi:MAG: hypothetical protein A2166_01325 [Omnitrophica WOR_2 bacterium RBG_13_41_10]|nr:MAG: hypothetical protein A2166_01325 [Omnitrophica WOR_2 bacterium RBG_13_41_10]